MLSNPSIAPQESKEKKSDSKSSDLKAAVALITAYIYQLARDVEIDPSLLGTRSDIEALVSGDKESRLLHGWRAVLVGQVSEEILTGKVSFAFDGENRILIEPRN